MRDIREVGDVWSVDLSPLELQNAETKRTAQASGSKHLTFNDTTVLKHPPPMKSAKVEGPQPLVKVKGYHGSMAASTMKNLRLGAQMLRRGDADFALPDSRRKERLFERGRTKAVMKRGDLKLDGDDDYDPDSDSCMTAFVRSMFMEPPPAAPKTNA